MRVSPDHGRNTAIESSAKRLLFRCGFGMEVDKNDVCAQLQGTRRHFALDGLKRIVERIHENASQRVQNQHVCAIGRPVKSGSTSGRARRKIQRAEEAFLTGNENKRIPLIPNMVPGCDHIGARVEQVLENHLGDAKAARRVLAIHDDKIGGETLSKRGERFTDRVPARPAQDVAEEEKPHYQSSQVMTREGVRTISKGSSCGSRGIAANSCSSKATPMAMSGWRALMSRKAAS